MRPYGPPTAVPFAPAQTYSPVAARARFVSLALVATALYGDLLKRMLPPAAALMSLYAIPICILLYMAATGRRAPTRVPVISTLAGFLILTYVCQLYTSSREEFLPALMVTTYMCVPLAFIFCIPRAYPAFDLRAMAFYTSVLIVPLHVVGLIQQFIEPGFMISNAYQEGGGIIVRNFLEPEGGAVGTFNRFPSLFTSADRYSGVSSMHIIFALLLLTDDRPPTRRMIAWIIISVLIGSVGLMIAGARSRIMIVVVIVIVAGMTLLLGAIRGRRSARKIVLRTSLTGLFVLAVSLFIEDVRERVLELPVISMMAQTVESDDTQKRLHEVADISAMPDDVTLFGAGLGASAGGRPGEFAIRGMWIEGGYFWTVLMLTIHAAIILWIGLNGLRAVQSGYAVLAVILAAAALIWLNGLLAGLSAAFELSIGLLLCPMIGVGAMMTQQLQFRRMLP